MAKSARPYRRSIWNTDPRYELDYSSLTEADVKTISKLAWVDAAKKNAPPIAAKSLLQISKAAKAIPSPKDVKAKEIEQYLQGGLDHLGAGIPTLICMLAVESNGDYPPIDRKFAAGMKRGKKISANEVGHLVAKDIVKFAKVYVEKVIPAWRESRKGRSPEQADNFWGRGGRDDS